MGESRLLALAIVSIESEFC